MKIFSRIAICGNQLLKLNSASQSRQLVAQLLNTKNQVRTIVLSTQKFGQPQQASSQAPSKAPQSDADKHEWERSDKTVNMLF